jgi:hypothetical protein
LLSRSVRNEFYAYVVLLREGIYLYPLTYPTHPCIRRQRRPDVNRVSPSRPFIIRLATSHDANEPSTNLLRRISWFVCIQSQCDRC